MAKVSWAQALAWRMGRQHLLHRAGPDRLERVAAQLCGLHAQVMSPAEMALWARADGLECYGLRDPAILELVEAIGAALDGTVLTRGELADEVGRRTGSAEKRVWIGSNWGEYLKPASWRGRLCFAPGEGRRVRFTHPASWVPGGVEPVDAEAALTQVARRYLAAHGPAEPRDLARWWGGAAGRARRMLDALAGQAVVVEVDGDRCWILAEDLPELLAAVPVRTVRLLPAFDPWVVAASRTTPALVAPEHRGRVYRPQGWMAPVLVVGGRIAGVWETGRSGGRLHVRITPFERLPATVRRPAEAEVDRLDGYLGAAPSVRWLD